VAGYGRLGGGGGQCGRLGPAAAVQWQLVEVVAGWQHRRRRGGGGAGEEEEGRKR